MAVGTEYRLLEATDRVVAAGTGLTGVSLLSDTQLTTARSRRARVDRGPLFPIRDNILRLYAVALPADGASTRCPVVAPVALRRDQRDEALRELIGELGPAKLTLRRSRGTAELEETPGNVAADAVRTLADTLLTFGVQPASAPDETADLAVPADEAAARYPGTTNAPIRTGSGRC